MKATVGEIASLIRGEVTGNAHLEISGVSSADRAGAGDLTFAENARHFAVADSSSAAAILVSEPFTSSTKALIRVKNVRVAIVHLLPRFFPLRNYPAGTAPTAAIDNSAQVDPTAHLGPHCIVAAGARIGKNCVLMGGNYVGENVQIGDEVRLFPNVVIYDRTVIGNRVAIHAGTTIGSDGYGYVFDQGRHCKVLQVGHVVIEDDVEIGANAAIDRGAFGPTIVGAGTKIDNLVHVAHNVVIGRHCLVMGQAGFAGSTQLGDYTVIASQSGIAGHLKLGRQSTVGAKSGVMRDVGDGETVLGIPAQPHKEMKRQWIALQRLPEMMRKLRDLETELAQLKAAVAVPPQGPNVQP